MTPLFELKGGSMATLRVFERGGKLIVRKSASEEGINNGKTKLYYEATYLKTLRKFYPDIIPEILEINVSDDQVAVEMPYYYDGLTLHDLIVKTNISQIAGKKIMFHILDYLFNTFYKVTDTGVANEVVKILYINRPKERIITGIEGNSNLKRISANESIIINKNRYTNPLILLDKLSNNERVLESISPRHIYQTHFDLIPHNILVNEELPKEFKLIDPRGQEGNLMASDYIYDMAKFKFGFSGFDILKNKRFTVRTIKDNEFIFFYDYSRLNKRSFWSELTFIDYIKTELKDQWITQDDSGWAERLLLAEASHFLSDIPCRMIKEGDDDTMLGFFLKGTILLNDVYNKMKVRHNLNIND
ncbi:MAG: hypothetical protein KKF44_09720 [Nanoarchaeota archaeon]|nr:hypothetical protein [Nanoarchaeota archaeon]